MRGFRHWRWHLDEMYVKLNGEMVYLWQGRGEAVSIVPVPATIIASTTAGATLADFADRSLGIGYPGGSLVLLACVLMSLLVWYRVMGTVAVETRITSGQDGISPHGWA